MRGCWPLLSSLIQCQYFTDASLEAAFQHKYRPLATQSCQLWAAIQVLYVVSCVTGGFSLPAIVPYGIFWALFAIPLAFGVILVGLSTSRLVTEGHLAYILAFCYVSTLAIHAIQNWLLLSFFRERQWGLPANDPISIAAADQVASFLYAIIFHVDQQLQILPMLHIGIGPASLIAVVANPLGHLLFTTLATSQYPLLPLTTIPSAIYVGVIFASCRHASNLRRAHFLLEQQRARHSDQVQQTDAMVNHILKNAMVEASGLVDLFLEACVPPPPEEAAAHLQGALERLRGGQAWCRRRAALLALMDGRATPCPCPTSLAGLGAEVVAARMMTADFSPLTVELDEVLTGLMLESAISNAFHHGHPTDPDVHFSVEVDPPHPPAAGLCTVTFRVTNRSAPGRPFVECLTQDSYSTISVTSPPEAHIPHSSGLRTCFFAAQLQGMAACLRQDGDLVVFQASLATRRAPEPAPPPPRDLNPPPPADKLPPGLRITVIDDSACACTLLKHQLTRDIPGCTVVTFGASVSDVDPFLTHTLLHADIAILDQHLDWPNNSHCLGTDLVRLLLQAGYRGFVCIRSANADETDLPGYFAAGAHCVLDKLLDRAEMVATLASQYRLFLAGRPALPSPIPDKEERATSSSPDLFPSSPLGIVPREPL